MNRRFVYIFGIFVAALTSAFVIATATALESESFNLRCTLTGPSGEHHYAFHIEIPQHFGAARVTLLVRSTLSFDLKIVHVDDTSILASLDTKMSDWPEAADLKYFRLSRISGDAEVNFLEKPTKEDPHQPPDGFLHVMDAFTQKGPCSKSERAF